MPKFILFCLLYILLAFKPALSSHVAGGEITYRYLGNQRYEINFTFYRDCRSSKLGQLPITTLQCLSGSTSVALNPKLVSITDISPSCASDSNRYSPSNSISKSKSPSFEEFKFRDTLDFETTHSVFKACCGVIVSMKEVARSAAITTGPDNTTFFISCTIDLCKAKYNSSPVFMTKPDMVLACNQPTYLLFTAIDTVDNDSISYSLAEAQTSLTANVSWNSTFSKNMPLSVYWPSGYDKAKGPKPDANPPIGLYLDPINGRMVFTPIDCAEITIIVVSVKEWRKDSAGKYVQIAEVKREIACIVSTSPGNNPPGFTDNTVNYTICEGEPFVLDVATKDIKFIPPPPARAKEDSTNLFYGAGMSGTEFKIINPTERLRTGRFIWTPDSIRQKPYTVVFKVVDNACPYSLFNYRTIKLTVAKNAPISKTFHQISNNRIVLKFKADSGFAPYILKQEVMDSSGKVVSEGAVFGRLNDTFVFNVPGIYLLKTIISVNGFCNHYYTDTVRIKQVMTLAYNLITANCVSQQKTIQALVTNGTKPITYTWFPNTVNSFSDTSPIFKFLGPDFLPNNKVYLKAIDANGLANYIWFNYSPTNLKPKFTLGKDTSFCVSNGIQLMTKTLVGGSIPNQWLWYLGGKLVNSSASFKTNTPGTYFVETIDLQGCRYYDTLLVKGRKNPELDLMGSEYCQDKNRLVQQEFILKPGSLNNLKSFNWQLSSLLRKPNGDLLTLEDILEDKDTTAGLDYNLNFGKTVINLGNKDQDSFKLNLFVMDSNACSSMDSAIFTIHRSPVLAFKSGFISFCQNEANIDLNTFVTHTGNQIIWQKVNEQGYDSFAKEETILDGKLKREEFKISGGLYRVKVSSSIGNCITKDSTAITILPTPYPKINTVFLGDSVEFTDLTPVFTERTWYLNASAISNAAKIRINTKSLIGKTIRLALSNKICKVDTSFYINTGQASPIVEDGIRIYPNPVSTNFTLEFNCEFGSDLELLNALGQVMLRQDLISSGEVINVEGISAGVYMLRVRVNNRHINSIIIIQ
jgi:hypothetical protein